MNKKYIIASVVALILVIALGITLYSALFSVPETAQPNTDASLLTIINQAVQAKAPEAANFTDITQNQQVSEGWSIKTSATGRALLELAGSATTIDKNSELTLEKQSNNQTVIALALGNVFAKVSKVFTAGEGYEVHSPNAVAAVRGTAFAVSYLDHITTVTVQENTVAVISINPADGKQVGQEVMVMAGQKAVIEDGKEPVIYDANTVVPSTVKPQTTTPKQITPTRSSTTAPASQLTAPAPTSDTNAAPTAGSSTAPTR